MLKPLLFVAGGLLVIVAGVYAFTYLSFPSRSRPPEELARQALGAATDEERVLAAVELARGGEPARAHLRTVLAGSTSADVRAAVIQGLAALRDWESMPKLLELLDDRSEKVRGRAGAAVTHLLGADYRYRANDPPESRARAVQAMRASYQTMQKSPPPTPPRN